MNFFLMKWFIDEIKSGKPIMYYNIETTDEEEKKRFLNTFGKNEKSILDDRVFKLTKRFNSNILKEEINV